MNHISDQEITEVIQSVLDRLYPKGQMTEKKVPDLTQPQTPPPPPPVVDQRRTIAIGADHGGVELKDYLKGLLVEKGYLVQDFGTHDTQSIDYPDFAHKVALKVSSGEAWRGIMIDGAGIGSCMAANKVPGVRAAMCYDHATAVNSREHNDANLLTLGAGLIGKNLAAQIVLTWLETEFGGGRHAKRVDKIMEIEKQHLVMGK
jgi:ribose 5-phosphate isomerase B